MQNNLWSSKTLQATFISAFIGISCTSNVHAQRSEVVDFVCAPPTYAVGYFNGIRQKPFSSAISPEQIRAIVGETDPNGNPVHAGIFINQTNKTWRDINEVIIQVAEEVEPNITQSFYDLFWLGEEGDPAANEELLGAQLNRQAVIKRTEKRVGTLNFSDTISYW